MSLSGRKTHLDRYRYTRKEPLILVENLSLDGSTQRTLQGIYGLLLALILQNYIILGFNLTAWIKESQVAQVVSRFK